MEEGVINSNYVKIYMYVPQGDLPQGNIVNGSQSYM